MLGRLLARAVNDVTSQDLHDRALLYHRLLKHDPEVARRVICCEKPPLPGEFAEDRDTSKLFLRTAEIGELMGINFILFLNVWQNGEGRMFCS